jgi:hypothetical protein
VHDDFRFPVLKKVLGDLSELFPLMADFVAKVFLHWRSKILLAVDAISV